MHFRSDVDDADVDADVEQVAVLCSDLDFARKMRRRSAIVIRGREEGFVMIQVCFSANHTPKADASFMAICIWLPDIVSFCNAAGNLCVEGIGKIRKAESSMVR